MANEAIRHARSFSPWFIPNKGGTADDLHGITDIGGAGASVDREDVFTVGRKLKCATDTDTPESTVPITQLERGTIDTYLVLANLDTEPSGGLTLEDFSNSLVDVVLYGRDSFEGEIELTKYFPKSAIETLNIDIADAEARIERSFDLTGDNEITLTDDNRFQIHRINTAPSGTSGNYIIDGTTIDPAPVEDPNNSGSFFFRIDRTRSGETVTLEEGPDYTYDSGLNEVTIIDGQAGDVYNLYYSASSFGTPGDPTTPDDEDPCFLKAENVTVLIEDVTTTEVELDLLTSFSINATANRIDENVIGNDERILREIEDTPVTVSLTGRVKKADIEKALMNKVGTTHGVQEVKLYQDDVTVTLKIFDDATKSNFLIGYQVSALAFDDDSLDITANEFATIDFTLGSDNLLITTTEGNL